MSPLAAFAILLTLLGSGAVAQASRCEDSVHAREDWRADPQSSARLPELTSEEQLRFRLLRYAWAARLHRASGLASYYSTSLDGLPTANGEIFRNNRLTAAHLTLPLGTWIEVHSRATGKRVRCRVNDRGPYAKRFFLDLSQAAARSIGVDRADDRHVTIRVIALPGEEPMPALVLPILPHTEEQGVAAE